MKPKLLPALLATLVALPSVRADEPGAKGTSPQSTESKSAQKGIKSWGTLVDPDGDCEFKAEAAKLTIIVPGVAKPHDLSAELSSTTAPRVLQPLKGDFVLQVKVEGEFAPGDKSTQEGRTGYTGAGLVVFADARNFVRIERASIGAGGETHPYTNFEIRVEGQLERIGTTGDFSIDAKKPVWLRLERKGDQMLGAMSQDGERWTYGEPKELRADAWKKPNVTGGVAAISTSVKSFAPVFSELTVGTGGKPAKVEKKDKAGE